MRSLLLAGAIAAAAPFVFVAVPASAQAASVAKFDSRAVVEAVSRDLAGREAQVARGGGEARGCMRRARYGHADVIGAETSEVAGQRALRADAPARRVSWRACCRIARR